MSFLHGDMEGVVSAIVNGCKVNLIGEKNAADGGEVVLGRNVEGSGVTCIASSG